MMRLRFASSHIIIPALEAPVKYRRRCIVNLWIKTTVPVPHMPSFPHGCLANPLSNFIEPCGKQKETQGRDI